MNRRRRILGAGLVLAGLLAAGMHIAAAADAPTIALVQINQQALFFTQMNEGAEKKAKEARRQPGHLQRQQRPGCPEQRDRDLHRPEGGRSGGGRDRRQRHHAGGRGGGQSGHPRGRRRCDPAPGPQLAQVGVDNEAAGKLIGEHFVKVVNEQMGGKAKLGSVGALNSFIQNVRQKGFDAVVATAPGITNAGVVDGRNVQDNAMAAAENLMTANPDLTAIYATGEPALLGAVAAVESQGRQGSVKVVGWDLTASAIKGIDDGYVVGVVQQDPAAMGAAAVDALMTSIKGGKVPAKIAVSITIVTKDNVEPYRAVFK